MLVLLASHWTPLGPEKGALRNFLFVGIVIGGLLGFFRLFQHFYAPVLAWFLRFKPVFLAVPVLLVVAGLAIWGGLGKNMADYEKQQNLLEETFAFTNAANIAKIRGGNAQRLFWS